MLAQRPAVGWFEAHSENYFAAGGALPQVLEQVRRDYPLALHGVGLSLGSAAPLDRQHVGHLRRLIDRFEPTLVSEHLSWGALGERHSNDLLPLPYTEESLQHVCDRVDELQQRLARRVLIENLSSYLVFRQSTIPEWDFLAALVQRSGCGLLLDVNNIYVNACNHGFDPLDFIAAIPKGTVDEIHLAGHSVVDAGAGAQLRIDTHGSPVCDEVWSLYAAALRRFGAVPTLIEWDTDIPELAELIAEAQRADAIAQEAVDAFAA